MKLLKFVKFSIIFFESFHTNVIQYTQILSFCRWCSCTSILSVFIHCYNSVYDFLSIVYMYLSSHIIITLEKRVKKEFLFLPSPSLLVEVYNVVATTYKCSRAAAITPVITATWQWKLLVVLLIVCVYVYVDFAITTTLIKSICTVTATFYCCCCLL